MSLKDDLTSEVRKIFASKWTERDGTVVPDTEDIQLGNDCVNLDATVLYADIDASTTLVDKYKATFSAEVYKSFLHCAAKIVKDEGGDVTAYDGDRVMAVFVGNTKNTSAVRAALKINWCVKKIVNPQLKEVYASTDYELHHTVGVDTSKLLVARTGVRGANDLVWVGRAANYAAKLTTLSADYPTRITGTVYDQIADEAKYTDGKNMWEQRQWTAMNNMTIYRSSWTWAV
jgi:class 3 adenylate cyclase